MVKVEESNQFLSGDNFQKLQEEYRIYPELWWDSFLDADKTDVEADQMFKGVDWGSEKAVGYLLKGLGDGAYMSSYFEAKDEFGNDEYNVGRLLSVCRVLPGETRGRDYMTSFVKDYFTDTKYKDIREEALALLQPKI